MEEPELWGGIECTVARLRSRWRDQIRETGHYDRIADLDLLTGMGLKRLRYPVLLDHVSPHTIEEACFGWHEERLARLEERGLPIIAGLLHHGSGPRYTSLADPKFASHLARHAARTANRFPHVTHYTPVNEPVTTARFSGLYGHWFPHGRDEGTFLQILFSEVSATVAAMRSIRTVVPEAVLVQTEDLGKTLSTPHMHYQAERDNQRRWLALDLLTGRVCAHHPWHRAFVAAGINRDDLDALVADPVPPGIIGINYYLTSDRYLDEELTAYPRRTWGSNTRERYADIEAVRVNTGPATETLYDRVMEVWQRYRTPVAVTEIHNGSSREEQLRWVADSMTHARDAIAAGAGLKAVTMWSLLGSFDWDTLLRRRHHHYEVGAFDIRFGCPRPTALAHAIRAIGETGSFDHPVLDGAGWWLTSNRFYRSNSNVTVLPPKRSGRQIGLIGSRTALGEAFQRLCRGRGLGVMSLAGPEEANDAAFWSDTGKSHVWAIIDATDPSPNARAIVISHWCGFRDLPLLALTTDSVFAGTIGRSYLEDDVHDEGSQAATIASRIEADVLSGSARTLLLRTGPLFSPWDDRHRTLNREMLDRDVSTLRSPTYVPDLVNIGLDLLIDGEAGLWHLANRGRMSTKELDQALSGRSPARAKGEHAVVERDVSLTSQRGNIMPTLDSALQRYHQARHTISRAERLLAGE